MISTLSLVETMTGRVLRTLPHSSLDWSTPLGGIPDLTATTPTDDVLDALASSDPVTGVRAQRPRELLRAILSGTWRLGLVASWAGHPLAGGPLVGADPPEQGRITLKAQGMERMLERRETWRWDGTGGLTHVSRDLEMSQTTPRRAIHELVAHAMTGPGGRLPIVLGAFPPAGSESMVWPSWDVRDIWGEVRKLIARVDGPDVRLDPMPARETDDGMVIDWLLEIGDPMLTTPTQRDADGVAHPPSLPRVLVPPVPSVERGRLTTHQWAFGDGQDRLRTVARASAEHLIAAGVPRLSTFDTGGGSSESPASTQGRADAALAATSVPMSGAWSASTTLDDIDIRAVRRGSVARLHVHGAVVVDDGTWDRRITKIEARGRDVALAFDEDPR